MSNYIIAQPYAATITATSEAATMPAANLDRPQPTDVWRSTSLTGQSIAIDLGSAKAVNIAALLFTNLTAAATWRVQAGSTTGVSDYDSGAVTAWAGATKNVDRPHCLLDLTAGPQTYRYWKITLTDASNPDTWFQAGRLILSKAFQGVRNYSYGAGRGFKDLSEREDAFGGQLLYETRARRPVLSFEAGWLNKAEMEGGILELQRTLDGPVLAMLDPAADAARMGRMYYGLLDLQPVVNTSYGLYATRFTVEGLI